MSLKKRRKLIVLLILLDMVLIMFSYMMALLIRMNVLADVSNSAEYSSKAMSFLIALISAAVMVVLYYIFGLYDSLSEKLKRGAFIVFVSNGVGLLSVGMVLFVFRLTDYSRLALLLYYFLSCFLVLLRRFIVHNILLHQRVNGIGKVRVILVGKGEMAERFFQAVSGNPDSEYSFVGYFSDGENPKISSYMGTEDGLRKALESNLADTVVIAPEAAEKEAIGNLIALCGRFGIGANVIPTYNDFIPATPAVEAEGNLKLIEVRSAANKGVSWLFAKRFFDIVLSFLALIVLSPLFLATALAIKFSSRGPVIFKQIRAGKNGKPFSMYKFRSMCVDAEQQLKNLQNLNESDGPTFKISNDPRITSVGKFIRKTSIDELPQLVNILKGDMSIVGPRPPLMNEIALYSDWDWGRLAVKPGLTCYWQIGGRSDLSFSEWMKLDLKYVEEQGFWTDVKIILKTVRIVLSGKGAY